MPVMRVNQPHVFADVGRVKGDEYTATEAEASLLEALGWSARVAHDGNVYPPVQHLTQPRKKRTYTRRDMRA